MNLTELTTPSVASYPLAAFKDHLHLGSGFIDDGAQDALLEAYLGTAIATIEGRTGKVLLERDYSWEITTWYATNRQGLPVSPVSAVSSVALVAMDGTETIIDPAKYALRKDDFRPELIANCLPHIPANSTVRIVFTAGYGAAWSDVPVDIAHAVMILAAGFYANRGDCAESGEAAMPFGVQAILERYRSVRLMGDSL